MAITFHPDYLTLEEYSKLCHIQPRSVMHRLRSGTLSGIEVDGHFFVNVKANPPQRFAHAITRKPGGGIHRINKELRAVIHWAGRKHIRAYPFLRAIIVGQIDAQVYGGEVFALNSDLEAFQKSKG